MPVSTLGSHLQQAPAQLGSGDRWPLAHQPSVRCHHPSATRDRQSSGPVFSPWPGLRKLGRPRSEGLP